VTLAPPKPSSVLIPGYRLDRYELLCPIAQGGMAAVWVGRQIGKHGFEKLVAIKTILPQFATDHRFQTMFLDEAHIASGIEHPNVAQILDLGEEHDVLYIVMEYVDGDAISKLHRAATKRNVPIPQGILLRMMADSAAGLHAAHDLHDKEGNLLNVVHRDVSPQNILISVKGVAKVIDFGIAKARDRAGGDTGTGVLKGKIHYMPPEQAVGKKVDRRADIWAMGAMLYHLLSGRAPYEAENSLATLHMLTSGRPPLPLPFSVPRSISAIVRRAMAHDPNNRFETAAEMQAAIEAAMIELKIMTTQADVAAFLAVHLSDRQAQRKQAIDLALKAAAERLRMQQLLKSTADSSSGITGLSPISGGFGLPDLGSNPGASNPAVSSGSSPGSNPGSASNPGLPPSSNNAIFGPEVSHPSFATLGSAALETVVANGAAPPSTRRNRTMIFGGVGVAVALVTIIAIFALRTGPTPSTEGEPDKKATAKGGEATSVNAKIESTTTASATTTATATATATAEPTTTATTATSAEPTATAPKLVPTGPKIVATAKPKPSTTATMPPKKIDNDGF
jgi:serine/threonine protein kinase